jgi:methionyl-tRNA formyltransferase
MRIIFMGTPDFAVPTLAALLAVGRDVAAVYTQPPRAAGRGMAERSSPVQRFAEESGLSVLTPSRLKSEEEQEQFHALGADAAVVVAYGLILPPALLEGTRHGAFNLHASLLPRWRGAAPIQRAIMAGDIETGVAVMRLEERLDTGPVCLTQRVPIAAEETAGELHDRLAALGATLMVKAMGALEQGSLNCRPQSDQGITYAAKIEREETRIDWSLPAREVHNRIRGLSPHPGAWFEAEFEGDASHGKRERVKALRSILAEGSGPAGSLLDERLTITCGEGAVRLIELQRAGKRPMSAEEFLRGVSFRAGVALS